MLMFCRKLAKALVIAGVLSSTVAQAQSGDDWDVAADPSRDLTIASVAYSSGITLQVQCLGGALDVGVSGLPPAVAAAHGFERRRSDGRTHPSYWIGAEDGVTMLSAQPARDARSFRAGGALTLRPVAQGPGPTRIHLDLPAQATGIDRVLSACGRALVDPRDDMLEAGDLLVEGPSLQAPAAAAGQQGSYRIELSCLIAAGRLSACQSDSETPRDPVGGAAAAAQANGTVVSLSDPQAAEGRRIDIVVMGERGARPPS